MRTFKTILIIFLAVTGFMLIAGLFIKKEYHVSRSVVIDRSTSDVFNYIVYLKNQDQYSKWAKMDEKMEKSYRGIDGTVGFVSAWRSEDQEVGTGEQEIKKISEGKRVDYELRFIKPFKAVEPAYMLTDSIGPGKTLVTWGFSGHMAYPLNISMLFMNFDKMIGDDLDVGLQNLKKIMENRAGQDGKK